MIIKELLTKANNEKKAMCVNHCEECEDDTFMPCAINTSCVDFSIVRKEVKPGVK